MRYSSLLFVFFYFSFPMPAQIPETQAARNLIYEAYVSGNAANWQRGVDRLNAWCGQHPDALDWHYEWALAEYGLIGSRLAAGSESLGDAVKQLQSRVEGLLKRRSDWAEAHALLGGLYGMRVHLSPSTTLFYGPKSVKHIDRALALDPQCPVAWVEKGNTRYHAPAIFGGNIDKAVECYAQAVALYKPRPGGDWMQLYALAWLGKAHAQSGTLKEALAAYREALRIAPGFRWVRDELLPALEAQIRQN